MASFSEALDHLLQGLVVTRGSYPPGSYLVHEVPQGDHNGMILAKRDPSHPVHCKPWEPDQDDILAMDWVLTQQQERNFLCLLTTTTPIAG